MLQIKFVMVTASMISFAFKSLSLALDSSSALMGDVAFPGG